METMLVLCLPGLAAMAAAYALGCVNGSILVSKYIFGDDIRNHGSGNAGLTNFYRTFGTKGVVGVLLSDILKAVIAVLLGGFVFGYFFGLPMVGKLAATSFVLLGHMYPVTFPWGKGRAVRRIGADGYRLARRPACIGGVSAGRGADPVCVSGIHLCGADLCRMSVAVLP